VQPLVEAGLANSEQLANLKHGVLLGEQQQSNAAHEEFLVARCASSAELLLQLLDSRVSDRYSGVHGMPPEERVDVVRKDKASLASLSV
jgi:hypothetical protein